MALAPAPTLEVVAEVAAVSRMVRTWAMAGRPGLAGLPATPSEARTALFMRSCGDMTSSRMQSPKSVLQPGEPWEAVRISPGTAEVALGFCLLAEDFVFSMYEPRFGPWEVEEERLPREPRPLPVGPALVDSLRRREEVRGEEVRGEEVRGEDVRVPPKAVPGCGGVASVTPPALATPPPASAGAAVAAGGPGVPAEACLDGGAVPFECAACFLKCSICLFDSSKRALVFEIAWDHTLLSPGTPVAAAGTPAETPSIGAPGHR